MSIIWPDSSPTAMVVMGVGFGRGFGFGFGPGPGFGLAPGSGSGDWYWMNDLGCRWLMGAVETNRPPGGALR